MKNNADWKLSSRKVWGASPAGWTFAPEMEPGTQNYFEKVLSERFTVEMPWLLKIIPFPKFKNKKVLEIGCGAGYDAYMFCLHKACYTGIDITPENVERTLKHLSFYHFDKYKVVEGDAENLNFDNNLFDIVFSNGVLHHTPDIKKSFCEVNRVLNTKGEFYVILYNKNSIFYWMTLFLTFYLLKLGFLKYTMKEILSNVECSISSEKPLVNVYRLQEVKTLLNETGFEIAESYIKKLVWQDLPSLIIFKKIRKKIPRNILEWFGNRFGWYIIVKAIKKCPLYGSADSQEKQK